MSDVLLPLFPLRTVLFKGGQLALRVFEPRYLGMVSRCMQKETDFGVVLIRSGQEARIERGTKQPEVYDIGTVARINDFNQLSDGLLGIVVIGQEKFKIATVFDREDHLLMAEVEYLPAEPVLPLSEGTESLREVLRELIKHPMIGKLQLEVNYDDASSVGLRLAELLPIEPETKQSLLQMMSPIDRLNELLKLVENLQS